MITGPTSVPTLATLALAEHTGAITRTVRDFPTDYWNDSCAALELTWAIEHGATGATTNPTIVGDVLKREMDVWAPRIRAISAERPDATDLEVTWQVIEEMAVRGWAMFQPVFEREGGHKGRLSIQTNPTYHGSDRPDGGPGSSFRDAGCQRPGQVPRDRGRSCGHRAGDLRGDLHQRHGQLHGAPGARGR